MTKLSDRIFKAICLLAALSDFDAFILICRLFKALPLVERLISRGVKLYAKFPLNICFADWFDILYAAVAF
ncbi:MAG TPA: hypothetical protein DDZ83_02785 [Nitrospinae bacterium]|nr:hypothetical protein [Nitrospinota bacterium]